MRRLLLFGTCIAAIAAPGPPPASAAPLSPQAAVGECAASPAGEVTVDHVGGSVRFDLRSESSMSSVRLVFRSSAATAGMDRLVIEGRSEESSGLALCVSRVTLLDGDGGPGPVYEPDLILPPEWNRRTALLADFDAAMPEELGGVELSLWAPQDAGGRFSLHLRRCELLSVADVAAQLLPPTPAREALPRSVGRRAPEEDWHWTNFGPGGGGWYRAVAISPHDGSCFVGADVGGIYRSTDNCRTWEIVNSGIPNLYVNTIVFHPSDPRIVFAGSNGGVLKSTDGGTTWAIKRVGFPPLVTFGLSAPVSAICVDPTDPGTVYAGIGHERDYGRLRAATVGGRILKSVDGGETWRMAELPGGEEAWRLSVLCLRVHPTDPSRIYAATQEGLFTSTDGGGSWTGLGEGTDGYATTFLAINRDDPAVMLLVYHGGPNGRGGVLKSTDAGEHWVESNEGLPADEDAWRIIADPDDADTYYVGWHRRSGLFVTHDCGATWHPVNLAGNIRSAWFFEGVNVTGIDIDPRNPSRLVYCNDMDLYQTLDAGQTWEQVATDLVSPATADSPATWRGRGCEVLCAVGPQTLAVDPTDPQTLYFGYWDTHAWKSDDGGKTCYRLTDGIGSGYGRMGCVVLDPANPDVVYLSKGRNHDQHRLYKSVNAGGDFHLVGHEGSGLPPGGIFNLLIDPESPAESRDVYVTVTGYGVYKSTDGGMSWHEQSAGLPEDSRMPKQLAIDGTDSRRLFLASGAHSHPETKQRVAGYIARTTDGGASWEVVKGGIEPQCIVIDPFDPQTILVGNRNFSGVDYPNALYKSVDGGDTWTSADQAAFLAGPGSRAGDQGARVFVTCLVADPATPGRIYASCYDEGYDVSNGRGVFVSNDHGDTWEPFALDGLSNYRVGTLVVDPTDPSRLYAGTGGNGFFRLGPPPE